MCKTNIICAGFGFLLSAGLAGCGSVGQQVKNMPIGVEALPQGAVRLTVGPDSVQAKCNKGDGTMDIDGSIIKYHSIGKPYTKGRYFIGCDPTTGLPAMWRNKPLQVVDGDAAQK